MQVVGPEQRAQMERAALAKQRLYGTPRVRNIAQAFKLEALAREQEEEAQKQLLLKEAAVRRATELQCRWLGYLRAEMARHRAEEQKKLDALKFIPMRKLITVSCRFLRVEEADMKGTRRFGPLVRNRQILFWIARNIGRKSYPEIGKAFNRHYATVMHGVSSVDAILNQGDRETKRKIEEIRGLL